MSKRIFDASVAFLGILMLAPLLVALALLVKVSDGGSVFYVQERVGWKGRPFRIWKFRSMRSVQGTAGPSITAAGDPRITAVGGFLRRWKLDELPQLFNVLMGEMSFVGPRPEVPKYVTLYTDAQRRVLDLRPGITDLATLKFRNEEELLAKAPDPEKYYREYCIPAKISLNLEYADRASVLDDFLLICRTIFAISDRGIEKVKGPTTGT